MLEEFERIDQRGGVLGAMETQYQRAKIQDESMLYEHQKHSGELPIVGVNTFLHPRADEEGYYVPRRAGPRHQGREGTADPECAGVPGASPGQDGRRRSGVFKKWPSGAATFLPS